MELLLLRYIKCHYIFYFSLLHSLFHFCGQKELFIVDFIDLLDILASKSLKIILCYQYILQVFKGLENIPTRQTLVPNTYIMEHIFNKVLLLLFLIPSY